MRAVTVGNKHLPKKMITICGGCDADFLQVIRGEVGELLVGQVVDSCEVLRFVLVGLVTEMLELRLQLDFDLIKGFD